MGGITVGIKDRGDIVRDSLGDLKSIAGRYGQVLGKTALPVDANANRIAAKVTKSSSTVTTIAAGDMAFT